MYYEAYHDPEPSMLAAPTRNPSPFRGKVRGQAAILTNKQIAAVEKYIDFHSNAPHSDRLKFRLSIYAGLRVAEITEMQTGDLLLKDGSISPYVRVRAKIAKGNRERQIPMHPKIRDAVAAFVAHHPDVPFIAFSKRGPKPKKQSITALTNYIWDLYQKVGLKGCSSHSGRRTFITNLARSLNGTNSTLRDVQQLAGHARLDTTEKYIGLSENLGELIGRLK